MFYPQFTSRDNMKCTITVDDGLMMASVACRPLACSVAICVSQRATQRARQQEEVKTVASVVFEASAVRSFGDLSFRCWWVVGACGSVIVR